MEIRKVNIKDKADLITELHSYKVIAPDEWLLLQTG